MIAESLIISKRLKITAATFENQNPGKKTGKPVWKSGSIKINAKKKQMMANVKKKAEIAKKKM